jgi:hypothetical protein
MVIRHRADLGVLRVQSKRYVLPLRALRWQQGDRTRRLPRWSPSVLAATAYPAVALTDLDAPDRSIAKKRMAMGNRLAAQSARQISLTVASGHPSLEAS